MTDWSPIHDSVFGRFGALRLHRIQPFVVGDCTGRCWILSFFCSELGPHVRRTWVLLSVGLSTSNTDHTQIIRNTCKVLYLLCCASSCKDLWRCKSLGHWTVRDHSLPHANQQCNSSESISVNLTSVTFDIVQLTAFHCKYYR